MAGQARGPSGRGLSPTPGLTQAQSHLGSFRNDVSAKWSFFITGSFLVDVSLSEDAMESHPSGWPVALSGAGSLPAL